MLLLLDSAFVLAYEEFFVVLAKCEFKDSMVKIGEVNINPGLEHISKFNAKHYIAAHN